MTLLHLDSSYLSTSKKNCTNIIAAIKLILIIPVAGVDTAWNDLYQHLQLCAISDLYRQHLLDEYGWILVRIETLNISSKINICTCYIHSLYNKDGVHMLQYHNFATAVLCMFNLHCYTHSSTALWSLLPYVHTLVPPHVLLVSRTQQSLADHQYLGHSRSLQCTMPSVLVEFPHHPS